MSVQTYRDLVVWQRAMDLVEAVYQASGNWPADERFGLTNQVRRAAVSIPANMAEGQGRQNSKEFVRFLAISNGSLLEVETHLLIARRLRYGDATCYDTLMSQAAEVGRLLHALIRSQRALIDRQLTTSNR